MTTKDVEKLHVWQNLCLLCYGQWLVRSLWQTLLYHPAIILSMVLLLLWITRESNEFKITRVSASVGFSGSGNWENLLRKIWFVGRNRPGIEFSFQFCCYSHYAGDLWKLVIWTLQMNTLYRRSNHVDSIDEVDKKWYQMTLNFLTFHWPVEWKIMDGDECFF